VGRERKGIKIKNKNKTKKTKLLSIMGGPLNNQ